MADATDPSTWECGCIGHQIKAMMALGRAPEDFPVLPFATIAAWSGLTLDQAKSATRQLAEKGAAQFVRGCWDDDGSPRGAGYALTPQGRLAVRRIEERERHG